MDRTLQRDAEFLKKPAMTGDFNKETRYKNFKQPFHFVDDI